MSVADKILMTREGWEELQAELSRLRAQQGSSNAQYKDLLLDYEPGDAGLRYMQGEVTSIGRRILHLEDVLSRAVAVVATDLAPGVVGVGSTVVVSWEDGDEETYVLVGPPEVNAEGNRISYDSPVGQAINGRRTGEWVEVAAPGGNTRLQIVSVG